MEEAFDLPNLNGKKMANILNLHFFNKNEEIRYNVTSRILKLNEDNHKTIKKLLFFIWWDETRLHDTITLSKFFGILTFALSKNVKTFEIFVNRIIDLFECVSTMSSVYFNKEHFENIVIKPFMGNKIKWDSIINPDDFFKKSFIYFINNCNYGGRERLINKDELPIIIKYSFTKYIYDLCVLQ